MAIARYYLGCPIWALRDWSGSLYTSSARGEERLEQYASVFNAVEGNGTFYGLPEPATVDRWRGATPEHFRFCFKLPRRITHELELRAAGRELELFLQRLGPLGVRLGPFMIQLPSRFGPDRLAELAGFLHRLPRAFRFALEVRHPGFFGSGRGARDLDGLLAAADVERVVLDTRALRSGPADHPDVLATSHAKPDLPPVAELAGRQPIVRFIAHPLAEFDEAGLQHWSGRLAGWISEGKTPFLMVHCPNNAHTPGIARRAHQILQTQVDVGALPAWPGELHRPARQLSLFESPASR